ncbi:hypothetical protein BV22DRAFT_1041669 [Leucogyrophana mollusca]|uniref:Uncharacterized protein n=1 Tax=Leucogyrophana mollusca TaxID=85980 RepID=A0ACB8B007_9AGAM|nr:hypothetical protein BV22DRAFT_1041669 [Leucogyrophana mollusca]
MNIFPRKPAFPLCLPHQAGPLLRLSAMHAAIPPFFPLPDGKRLARVPHTLLSTASRGSIPPIKFSTNGLPGIRVKDVLKATVLIDGPNDRIFEHRGWRMTNIALEWPGYVPRATNDSSHLRLSTTVDFVPITRSQLASEICSLLWHYSYKVVGKSVTRGFERWALDPSAVHVNDIWLLSLHYYRNVWVPEFYVKH